MIKTSKSEVDHCSYVSSTLCCYERPPSLKAGTTTGSPLLSEDAGTTNWIQTDSRSFLYDSWNVIQEVRTQDSEVSTNEYVWGLDLSGSLQGAGGIGGLLASISGTNACFPTFDGNGNVSELLDVSGTIAAHYEYSPFGETIVATGQLANENKFRFSTKYFCDEFGMGDWGYRWYSSSMGRWLSRDPVGEQGGLNLYTHNFNSPLIYVDSHGESVISTGAIVTALMGVGAVIIDGILLKITNRTDPPEYCCYPDKWQHCFFHCLYAKYFGVLPAVIHAYSTERWMDKVLLQLERWWPNIRGGCGSREDEIANLMGVKEGLRGSLQRFGMDFSHSCKEGCKDACNITE